MTSVVAGARFNVGPTKAGRYPAIYLSIGELHVRELSVFIDESGDFGTYYSHSPYYIVSLVFHEQDIDINKDINELNEKLRQSNITVNPIHSAPLIRREGEYKNYTLLERKRIFNLLYNFTRNANIAYRCFVVEKKQLADEVGLQMQLTKLFSSFFRENIEHFLKYDRILVYYDYGQRELSLSIVAIFTALLGTVHFKKGTQAEYKLFQAADLLCTMELLSLKAERKMLSKSELLLFKSAKDLNKSYLRAMRKKRF